ncbi:MAG: histone-like protein [Candidatus Thermoplasmatota archaeon]
MKELMKASGIDYVSKEAVEYLRQVLEDEAKMITAQAAIFMGFAGRKTILARDLQLAMMRASELLKDVDIKSFINKREKMT